MEDFVQRIARAKQDNRELDRLVSDYLPFIKKEVGKFGTSVLEYDDKLSLGMLVFANCAKQYSERRGAFLPYASVCIRNRLIDEARKLGNLKDNTIAFALDDDAETATTIEEKASLAEYSKQQEQRALQEELAILTGQLAPHDISLGEMARICPKQKRSRALCADLARQVLNNEAMQAVFRQRGQLPQKELAARAGISEKTIEKHRRFIVALLVILQGDYPGIGSYIPGYREVE